jgi:threonine dehydrogenase-like Zn-dependent dehydrogenase
VEGDRESVLAAVGVSPPDIVFESVGGKAATLDIALEAVRPGGVIVALGVFSRAVTLHPIRFLAKEVRLVASMMYSRKPPRSDFATALHLLREDRERLAPMLTHRVPLDAIDEGFAIASDKRSGALKVCVDVGRMPATSAPDIVDGRR